MLLLALFAPSAQAAEALPDPWPNDAYPGPALHIPDPDVDFLMTGGFGNSAYIWVGDFNGDGITDVASAMGAVGRIAESRGNDTWVTVDHDTRSPYWGHASYARVGDFDGDGKDDFISVEGDDIVIRRASEGFAMARFDVPGGWGEAAMTRVGDFDGDGNDDYATIRPTAVHVHLARFAASGDFDSQPWAVTDWWGQPGYTFVGDFNGDGRDDIATAQYGNVRVRLSTGSGFTDETWTVPANWGAGHSSFVGDFNGDGKDDIVSVQNDFINENQSTGSGFIQRRSGAIKAKGEYLMVGDFDGDGRDDVASPAGDVVRIYARREGDDRLHLAEEWQAPNNWGATYLTWAGELRCGVRRTPAGDVEQDP